MTIIIIIMIFTLNNLYHEQVIEVMPFFDAGYVTNEWHDFEIWVWGHSRSLKIVPFDRPYTTFY